MAEPARCDLAIIGAGVSGCALAAQLRRLGWGGSIQLLEIGRGPGGRAATRLSRQDAALRLNHGAPLFNIRTGDTAPPPPHLLEPLQNGDWITPWVGAIRSLNDDGQLNDPIDDGFSDGDLWQGNGGMEQICRGLLSLAEAQPGSTQLHASTLVRHLDPQHGPHGELTGWHLRNGEGEPLLRSPWLVLSGTLLAHPRCRTVFDWSEVPLQAAAERCADPALEQATAHLAAIDSAARSNLLLVLPATVAAPWLALPWRLIQFSPEAQARWGLRRLSLQPLADGRCGLVAESSPSFAADHRRVYGSRSSAAQLLGAAPDPADEAAVLDALQAAVAAALACQLPGTALESLARADRQLMRWGAAFPIAGGPQPGLPEALSLCPASRIGFCGDAAAGPGFGRVEGALRSAEDLAERLLAVL
ncbi:MAG: NAD(P)-binding protein [Vulcanococcus sp.]